MEVGCNLGYGDVGVDNWGMCVGECGECMWVWLVCGGVAEGQGDVRYKCLITGVVNYCPAGYEYG